MDREAMVRESEQAAIDRWFPRSPLGPMFDAGDGRMLPMPADAIGTWRAEAFAIVDAFIVDSRPPPQSALFGIVFLFAALFMVIESFVRLPGGTMAVLFAVGTMAWHARDVLRMLRFRRNLRELRGRIAASLALRAPLPAELAARFRRRNPWRTALHVWVWSLVVIALAAQHFVPAERVMVAFVYVALGAVGVAWLLHFAARRVDRAATLEIPANPPISPA